MHFAVCKIYRLFFSSLIFVSRFSHILWSKYNFTKMASYIVAYSSSTTTLAHHSLSREMLGKIRTIFMHSIQIEIERHASWWDKKFTFVCENIFWCRLYTVQVYSTTVYTLHTLWYSCTAVHAILFNVHWRPDIHINTNAWQLRQCNHIMYYI